MNIKYWIYSTECIFLLLMKTCFSLLLLHMIKRKLIIKCYKSLFQLNVYFNSLIDTCCTFPPTFLHRKPHSTAHKNTQNCQTKRWVYASKYLLVIYSPSVISTRTKCEGEKEGFSADRGVCLWLWGCSVSLALQSFE